MNFLNLVRSVVSSNPDLKRQEGQLQAIMKLIQTELQNGPIKLDKSEEKDLNSFFKQTLEIIHKERSLGTDEDKITGIISTMIHENRILKATGLIYNSELLAKINKHLFFKKLNTPDEAYFFPKRDPVETEISVMLISAKDEGREALKRYFHEILDDRGSIPIETFFKVVLNKYNKNEINAENIIALIEETQRQMKSLAQSVRTNLSEVLKNRSESVLTFILKEMTAGNFLKNPLEKQSFRNAIESRKITETRIVCEIKKQLGLKGDSFLGEDEEEETQFSDAPALPLLHFEDDTEIPKIATTSSTTATVPVPDPVIEDEWQEHPSRTEIKELFNSLLKLDGDFYADNVAENIIHLNRIAKETSSGGEYSLDRMLIQNCFRHLFQEITKEDSTLEGMLIGMRHEEHTLNVLNALYNLFASPDTLKFMDKKTYPLFKKAFEKIDHACAQQNNNKGTVQWCTAVQLWDNVFRHAAPKMTQAHSIPPVRHILTVEEVKARQELIRAEKQILFLENPENQKKFLNGTHVFKLEGLRKEYKFLLQRFLTITERVDTKESVFKNVETFSKKVDEFYNGVKKNPRNALEAHRTYWGGVEKVTYHKPQVSE